MKRPADDNEAPAALRPGAFKPLPQLSTARTLEALAAGCGAGMGIAPGPHAAPIPVRPVMCKFFLRNMCAKGKSCPFSHEVNDMQEVPIEHKARSICKFFELGQCNRGGACKFAHGERELSRVLSIPKKRREGAEEAEIAAFEASGEIASADSISLSLQAASGFQSFDQFDVAAGGKTEVVAGATEDNREVERSDFLEPRPEGESAVNADDDIWNSFLAEVGVDEAKDAAASKEQSSVPSITTASGATVRVVPNFQSGSSSGSTSSPPGKVTLRLRDGAEWPKGAVGPASADHSPGKGGKGNGWDAQSQWNSWDAQRPKGKGAKGQSGGCGSDAFGAWAGGANLRAVDWNSGKAGWGDGSVWHIGKGSSWTGATNGSDGSADILGQAGSLSKAESGNGAPQGVTVGSWQQWHSAPSEPPGQSVGRIWPPQPFQPNGVVEST